MLLAGSLLTSALPIATAQAQSRGVTTDTGGVTTDTGGVTTDTGGLSTEVGSLTVETANKLSTDLETALESCGGAVCADMIPLIEASKDFIERADSVSESAE